MHILCIRPHSSAVYVGMEVVAVYHNIMEEYQYSSAGLKLPNGIISEKALTVYHTGLTLLPSARCLCVENINSIFHFCLHLVVL